MSKPMPENSTMIPRQKTTACATPSRLPPACRLRKYDMVMGIMGKTQGVKMQANPTPKASSRNCARPVSAEAGDAEPEGAGVAS